MPDRIPTPEQFGSICQQLDRYIDTLRQFLAITPDGRSAEGNDGPLLAAAEELRRVLRGDEPRSPFGWLTDLKPSDRPDGIAQGGSDLQPDPNDEDVDRPRDAIDDALDVMAQRILRFQELPEPERSQAFDREWPDIYRDLCGKLFLPGPDVSDPDGPGEQAKQPAGEPAQLDDKSREELATVEILMREMELALELPVPERVAALRASSKRFQEWYSSRFCSVPDVADVAARFPVFLDLAHHFNHMAIRAVEPPIPLIPPGMVETEIRTAAVNAMLSWEALDPTAAWLSVPELSPLLDGLNRYYATFQEIMITAGCLDALHVIADHSYRYRLIPPPGSLDFSSLDVATAIRPEHIPLLVETWHDILDWYKSLLEPILDRIEADDQATRDSVGSGTQPNREILPDSEDGDRVSMKEACEAANKRGVKIGLSGFYKAWEKSGLEIRGASGLGRGRTRSLVRKSDLKNWILERLGKDWAG